MLKVVLFQNCQEVYDLHKHVGNTALFNIENTGLAYCAASKEGAGTKVSYTTFSSLVTFAQSIGANSLHCFLV